MTRKLFIVRHGNTFAPGETARRIGSRTDIPLVESGEAQADALGASFARMGVRFDQALTSPLLRTRQTADRILRRQPGPLTVAVVPWLAEIDHGPDEGQADPLIVARIGAAALARWDSDAIAPPGWIVDAESRLAAWRSLFEDQARRAAGNVLIVTSNGSARFALAAQPNLVADARARASLKLRTGAWGELEVDDTGSARLLTWDERP
jgi:broad specificity phosphatase PhoE